MVQLSRICGIKRPNLYRILELFTDKGLVETRLDDKTTYYRAADPKMLEVLVREQENKAREMRESLSQIQSHLHLVSSHDSETHVHYYRGIRGLQHMLLKMHTQPKTTIYVFGSDDWREMIDFDFAEEMRAETVKQNSMIYELLNPEDDKSISQNGVVNWTKNLTYVLKHFRHRQISKKVLTMDKEIIVYNNFIHFYSYKDNDITGIEIENELYSQIIKQLFKLAWNCAKKVDDFG